MGADGDGCSAELESNGAAKEWEFGALPVETAPLPMTCEWLDSDNCWKQMFDDLRECMPEGSQGSFSEDRSSCELDNGAVSEWDGTVDVPDPGTVHAPIIQQRFLDAQGDPCFTAKFLGIAHVAYDVEGRVGVLQATNLTTFKLICPDGATYANDVEGTCPDIGARWLAGGLPGYNVVCDGDRASCDLSFTGVEGGRVTVAACGY